MKNVRKDSPRTDSVLRAPSLISTTSINQQARENALTKIIWLFSFKKKKIPNKVILQTFYPVTTQLQSKNFFVLVKSTRRQESQSE